MVAWLKGREKGKGNEATRQQGNKATRQRGNKEIQLGQSETKNELKTFTKLLVALLPRSLDSAFKKR
jgi:hypothetical protein